MLVVCLVDCLADCGGLFRNSVEISLRFGNLDVVFSLGFIDLLVWFCLVGDFVWFVVSLVLFCVEVYDVVILLLLWFVGICFVVIFVCLEVNCVLFDVCCYGLFIFLLAWLWFVIFITVCFALL